MLFRTLTLTGISILLAGTANAAPKLPVAPLGDLRAEALGAFRTAFEKTPGHLRSKNVYGEAYMAPFGGGKAGRVSSMENGPNGDVKMTSYSIPESDLVAENVRVTMTQNRSGVQRTFDTLSGRVTVLSDYRVEAIDGKVVRTQLSERKSTKEFEALTTLSADGVLRYRLHLNSAGPGGQLDFIGSHGFTAADGRVIGFSMAGNGQKITVHLMKDGVINERLLALKADPKAPEGDPSNFHVESVSNPRPLVEHELKKLGYLKAGLQSFPGRIEETAGKTVRGMTVNDGAATARP